LFAQGDFILETCKMKGEKMTGDCSVTFKVEGNQLIATVKINGEGNVMVSKHIRPSSGGITGYSACHIMIISHYDL